MHVYWEIGTASKIQAEINLSDRNVIVREHNLADRTVNRYAASLNDPNLIKKIARKTATSA